jgi:A/G-specific adenine glycosylase
MTSRIATMAPPARKASPDPAAREALLAWFRAEGAAYPWRSPQPDPYVVLVSEFMLQQTQAARVAEALPPFLRRFPDVRALARSSPADVIRAWQGLGYNRRAVRLHGAARAIVDRHDGRVPSNPVELRALPGVGPYTAAAVASIAYGVRVAAVDSNVRRVVARALLGSEPSDARHPEIDAAASSWLAPEDPGAWNQAVMDLGRFVCRPEPRCAVCPVASGCRSVDGRTAPEQSRSHRTSPRFEGSTRQARGRVIERLRFVPSERVAELALTLSRPDPEIREIVGALERDGLVERVGRGRIRLPITP